jgi:hypothetical protein
MEIVDRSVTAVIPTRGDVAVGRIIDKLVACSKIGEIRLIKADSPFGRFLPMLNASPESIFYTQDDDCVTDPTLLFAEEFHFGCIVNAMTPQHAAKYQGRQTLIGFGALMAAGDVIRAFEDWPWLQDELFRREADRVLTALIPHRTVLMDIEILECASAPNRLWKQPNHLSALREINRRIAETAGIAL